MLIDNLTKSLLLLICTCLACKTHDGGIYLLKNGNSVYQIVLPTEADSLEIRASSELKKYLQAIGSVNIPIVSEAEQGDQPSIFIGSTSQCPELKSYEILIRSHKGNLIIAGGDPRSTLYAVYTFLEQYLGCRFYTPEDEAIPRETTVTLPEKIDHHYLPPITTRTVHSRLFYEYPEFADRLKVTHEAFPRYVPNARVHTFHRFLPESKYFAQHPEFYALRNGARTPTQLCLTNDRVFELVRDTVASLIEKYPQAQVISVSQDDNQQYCQCEPCSEIHAREESPAGSMIEFVNRVAAEFPQKTISTLAYQYTRKAPKHLRPLDNVLITLCSIECDRSAPIEEKCPEFTRDLQAWSNKTDNIRIWDYTTQFTNFLAPFPNLRTLQPNINLFRENHAKWIFEQHSRHPSELFELRSYLTAKLLWNPELDADSITNDFLNGYYQRAAPFISLYLNTIHDELKRQKDFFLFLYGDPSQGFDSFLSPQLLEQYLSWFDQAELEVKDKPDIQQRVKRARLGVDYAALEASRKQLSSTLSMALEKEGERIISPLLTRRLNNFEQVTTASGITLMNEMGYTVKEYLDAYQVTLDRALEENKAYAKPVQLLEKPKKYADEDPKTLTDGAFGGSSFYSGWLGFEGNDLEAVIDLEQTTEVNRFSAAFLQVSNHLVFFPEIVSYFYSLDGENFHPLGKVDNKYPLKRNSKVNDIQLFDLEVKPVNARYIKIVGENIKTAPYWHHGTGLPGWIFVDEVMVQ